MRTRLRGWVAGLLLLFIASGCGRDDGEDDEQSATTAALAQNQYFAWATWLNGLPAQPLTFAPGDFDGNGVIDLAAYNPANGTIRIAKNGAYGQFTSLTVPWRTLIPAAGWTLVPGEFTGDNFVDLFAYHPSDGSIWVLGSDGDHEFIAERWGTVSPAGDWRFVAGHFDFTDDDDEGNDYLDVAGYHPTGSIYVGFSTPAGGTRQFIFAPWATVTPAAGWVFQTGDFSQDHKRTDIVGHHPIGGAIYVGRNTGSSFSFASWGNTSVNQTVQLASGRFTWSGGDDLAVYNPGSGAILVGLNHNDHFVFEQWAGVSPPSGWKFFAGDFTADERVDVLAYHAADGSIAVGDNLVPALSGYAWPLSAAPGQTIHFMTSTPFETVRFYRHGSTSSTQVGQRNGVSGVQLSPQTAQPNGAGWAPGFSWTIPNSAAWKSGLYSARLVHTNEANPATTTEYDIPFIVKAAPSARKTIAVIANVNTWNAYNQWNGRTRMRSKYSGAATTSFLRPYNLKAGFSASPIEGNDYHLTRAERFILGWLEDNGFHHDVYTDIDFHDGAVTYAAGYRKLVLSTHPEYWTVQMRENLDSFLAAGGSLVYLGGNGIFESLVYGDQPNCNASSVTCFRARAIYMNGRESARSSDAEKWRALSTFRAIGLHERNVLGVATARCESEGDPYRVRNLDPQIFAGTGLGLDGRFGTAGIATDSGKYDGGASGSETDTSLTSHANYLPCGISFENLPPEDKPPFPSTGPPNLVLLAVGCSALLPDGSPPGYNPDCAGGHMTFYRHAGGGFVFSVGSILFGRSLAFSPTPQSTPIQKIIKNVMNLN